MSTVTQCSLAELLGRLPQPLDYLMASASYEERAYGVTQQLRDGVRGRCYVCYNGNHSSYLHNSVQRFKLLVPHAELVVLDSDRPVETFNTLRTVVDSISKSGPCHLGIDVTCFTREATSILLFMLCRGLPKGSVVTLFYQKAKTYGRSRRGGWLTEGCREVRTILGYAGAVKLGSRTHLVVLPGFEYERAQEIVDAVQPDRISLGHSTAEESISTTLSHDHDAFLQRLAGLYLGPSFDPFEFSCVDPFRTRHSVLKVIRASSDMNVVVACLNTKPAMVGVCLAAMENPKVQIVYAQPVGYNTTDYSEPLGEVLFFTLSIK